MIISHKFKYIFIKPRKVAGTSVEVTLAPYCDQTDIVTPVLEYSAGRDHDFFVHSARNYAGYSNHMTPEAIKRKIGRDVWDGYFKFTIIRNPWDRLVSRYCSDLFYAAGRSAGRKNLSALNASDSSMRQGTKADFKLFLATQLPEYSSDMYYFDDCGRPIADFYVRFENLEGDYMKVCEKLGVPQTALLKIKTKLRGNKKHYSFYYDVETKVLVAEKFRKQIEWFDYKFEDDPAFTEPGRFWFTGKAN